MPIKVKTDKKIIICGRDQQIVQFGVDLSTQCGFDTFGALTNEEAMAILKKRDAKMFAACLLGCTFWHHAEGGDGRYVEEMAELKAIMQEHEIPVIKMQSYGDVITPLFKLGVYQPQRTPEAMKMHRHASGDPNFVLPGNENLITEANLIAG